MSRFELWFLEMRQRAIKQAIFLEPMTEMEKEMYA